MMSAQDVPAPSLWQVRFRLLARGALPDLPAPLTLAVGAGAGAAELVAVARLAHVAPTAL